MYYKVIKENPGCTHCGHGSMFTIVSGAGADEYGIGNSWGDEEHAEDICMLMNMAYDAGTEKVTDNAEEAKLVDFFRSTEGQRLGMDGDHDALTPAETAIRAMRSLQTTANTDEGKQ